MFVGLILSPTMHIVTGYGTANAWTMLLESTFALDMSPQTSLKPHSVGSSITNLGRGWGSGNVWNVQKKMGFKWFSSRCTCEYKYIYIYYIYIYIYIIYIYIYVYIYIIYIYIFIYWGIHRYTKPHDLPENSASIPEDALASLGGTDLNAVLLQSAAAWRNQIELVRFG